MRAFMVDAALLALMLAGSVTASQNALKRDVHDCSGVFQVENIPNTSRCCVGGTIPPVVLSTCKGWPICTGPPTITATPTPISCATVITYAVDGSVNADYSSLVSEANESVKESGADFKTTLAGVTGGGSGGGVSASAGPSASVTAGSGGDGNGAGQLALQLGAVGAAIMLGLAILL